MLECGEHELPIYDSNGEDGIYTFLCMENGIKIPTKEYELVKCVQEGKKSVNLQIKLWAEDIGVLLMPMELNEYCKGKYPNWVFKSTILQAQKRYIDSIGFIPTFCKIIS